MNTWTFSILLTGVFTTVYFFSEKSNKNYEIPYEWETPDPNKKVWYYDPDEQRYYYYEDKPPTQAEVEEGKRYAPKKEVEKTYVIKGDGFEEVEDDWEYEEDMREEYENENFWDH